MSNLSLVLIVVLVAAAAVVLVVIGYRLAVARRPQSTLLAPPLLPDLAEEQVEDADGGLDSKSVIEDVLEEATRPEATKAEPTKPEPVRLRDRLGRTRCIRWGACRRLRAQFNGRRGVGVARGGFNQCGCWREHRNATGGGS